MYLILIEALGNARSEKLLRALRRVAKIGDVRAIAFFCERLGEHQLPPPASTNVREVRGAERPFFRLARETSCVRQKAAQWRALAWIKTE